MITTKKSLLGQHNELDIFKYEIKNSNGFQVDVINYGCIITGIHVKNKNGKIENVVLGYNKLSEYENDKAAFGCLVGRTAGRTENGQFKINDKEYQLYLNNNKNSLHGGSSKLSKKVYSSEVIDNGVVFKYISENMDGGYPGELQIEAKYVVTDKNELIIEYKAISTEDTYVNLTNHTYFNLSGQEDNGDFRENGSEQYLIINSDYVYELNENMIPTWNMIDVKNTIFDFNNENPRKIKDGLLQSHSQFEITSGYDHPFLLNKRNNETEYAAKLISQESGISMEVYTNQNAIVFYSGNFVDIVRPVGASENEKYYGICLEAQNVPNAINSNNKEIVENAILKKDEEYIWKSKWKFNI